MARNDKELAVQLRREGKTYGEIRNRLGPVAKSTLALWFKDIQDIDTQILLKGREKSRFIAGQNRRNKKIALTSKTISESREEFASIIANPL